MSVSLSLRSAIAAQLAMLAVCFASTTASAQDAAADIAKKLNNPIADLISVPFQLNYDTDIGPANDGDRYVLNVQPVIPFTLNDDWNIVSRTIVPLISQSDVPSGSDESGLGDIFQNFFFSPKAPTAGGWIWGAGPALLLPTATDDTLGSRKWGIGPTAVMLKQANGWTYGALANHVWSFAGDDDRADISSTFMQPFVAYTTPELTTYTLNTESSYDWNGEQWSVPINLLVTQLFRIGKQPMTIQFGARYWADAPDSGAGGWGWRLTYTLVIPR